MKATKRLAHRTELMGILNVTPDSFSDGGLWVDPEVALGRARELMAQGCSIIDVGGESTRPGADRVDVRTEWNRVLPVVRALVAEGIPTSVDTTRAEVAAGSLAAGAVMINDVSGGLADPRMPSVMAESDARFVVMHSRGPSRDMYANAHYRDVVDEVCRELDERLVLLGRSGVDRDRMLVDPGLGFAKNSTQSWQLLLGLRRVAELGPVLVGASRKSFLAAAADLPDEPALDVATALVTMQVAGVARYVRVHDPVLSLIACGMAATLGGPHASAVTAAAARGAGHVARR